MIHLSSREQTFRFPLDDELLRGMITQQRMSEILQVPEVTRVRRGHSG